MRADTDVGSVITAGQSGVQWGYPGGFCPTAPRWYASGGMSSYVQAMIDAAFGAYEVGRHAEAAAALRYVVGTGADGFVAWFIGHLELRRGDARAALPWLTAAVAFEPARTMAHRNLGDAWRMLDRPDAAAAAYRQAIALDPRSVEPYNGLATMLHLLNRDAEALVWAEQALRDAEDIGAAHRIVGNVLTWHNRFGAAVEHYRAAQALRPDDATARNHEGMDLLALGQFREGWRLHDARRRIVPEEPGRHDFSGPIWLGEDDIAGRSILLHAEQGFGDAIQFVRYAPLVAARGAEVWLEVQAELRALFAAVPGIAGLLSPGDPRPDCALHCPLMSLPLACGTELASVPSGVPYLHADPRLVSTWRARLGSAQGRQVGLAWSGNPLHPHDRLRSIELARLAPLLARHDCVFHVVQTGVREADRPHLAAPNLRDHSAALTDFAEAAALMACLDLVVTVDSAPAHLSGALARPTWLLLPWYAEWRWMCDRSDSPWYPTMRLFRQPVAGDWEAVIAAVGAALDAWPEAPSGGPMDGLADARCWSGAGVARC